MRAHSLLIVPALLAAPASAWSQAAPAAAQPAANAPDAADKKICRRDVGTGSILPKRICHTKAEWTEIDGANQDHARTALDRRRTSFKEH